MFQVLLFSGPHFVGYTKSHPHTHIMMIVGYLIVRSIVPFLKNYLVGRGGGAGIVPIEIPLNPILATEEEGTKNIIKRSEFTTECPESNNCCDSERCIRRAPHTHTSK